MKRGGLLAIGLAVVVVIAIFYAVHSVPKEEVVKVGYLSVGSWPVDIAREEMLFEKANITAEFTVLADVKQMTDALVRGEIDIAPANAIYPVLELESVSPGNIKIFSVGYMHSDPIFDAILVKNDSSIKTLSDLEGKKIATGPGSTSIVFLKEFLKKHNVDYSKIEFIPMSFQNHLAALSSGSVEASFAFEPLLTIAENNHIGRKISGSVFADLIDPAPQAAGVLSSSFVREKPELAKKAVEIFDEASDFSTNNEEAMRTIILPKYSHLDESVASKVTYVTMGKSNNPNDEPYLQSYVHLLYSLGELDHEINISSMMYTP